MERFNTYPSGLFLLAKSTHEIHDKLEGEEGESSARTFHHLKP